MSRPPRLRRIPDALRTILERLGPRLALGLGASAVVLLLFALLAREMAKGDTMRFDDALRLAVHSFASPGVTAAFRGLTWLGSFAVLAPATLLSAFVFHRLARTRAALLLVITMMGAGALMELLKLLFRRERPVPFFDIPPPGGYSFPSGHALASFCFYGALGALVAVRVRRRRVKAVVWAATALVVAAVGLSRVYLGVHYPSDVLAGYAAAFVWVLAVASADRILRPADKRGARAAAAEPPPGAGPETVRT